MAMLQRMSTVVKSKMNRLLDRAEDPRETLDYAYEQQMSMLRAVSYTHLTLPTNREV